MKARSFFIVLIFFCIFFGNNVAAQEATFTTQVSSSNISVNEQMQISFTINASAKNFQPPSFENFTILSGPNQSSSMQFVNGNMSQSVSLSYYLQPKSAGTFKIGSATIEVGGKTLKSNIVTITVTASSDKSRAGSQEESIQAQIAKNIFIKATTNKTNAYVGEGIPVTYKLYTRVDLVELGNLKMPTLDGFWSQDIDSDKQAKFVQTTIDGVPYNVAEIKKTILFPQRAGKLTLDKMETEVVVRVRTQGRKRSNDPFSDFFDDPFFGGNVQDVKHSLASTPITIQVKPLPPNAPPTFNGAVGNYKMDAFLDKIKTKAGEPVTLKIKITGSGNIKLLEPIQITLPPDFETYDPKINENISVSIDGVKGSRIYEYLLIPRNAGNYKIDPIQFSYFDLATSKYQTIVSKDLIVEVSKSDNPDANNSVSMNAKSDLTQLAKEIRYIHTSNVTLTAISTEPFIGSTLYYLLIGLPFLGLIGFISFYKKQQHESSDVVGTRSKKARKLAIGKLAGAAKLLKENNYARVYEEIHRAMWGYVKDKYNVTAVELNKENIQQLLLSKNKQPEVVSDFMKILNDCEFARYSPAASMQNAQETYQQSVDVITKIES